MSDKFRKQNLQIYNNWQRKMRDVFGKIKTAKGSGNDNISSLFLKLALPFILSSLAPFLTFLLKLALFLTYGKLLG